MKIYSRITKILLKHCIEYLFSEQDLKKSESSRFNYVYFLPSLQNKQVIQTRVFLSNEQRSFKVTKSWGNTCSAY